MANSDFARRQLEKHGWKKGAGLGKEEAGRADPIKVTLKMDKNGLGHDRGKDFTDHWWLRVFNDAAKKIGTGEKTDLSKHMESKKEREMADRKKKFYSGFVKSSTLSNGVEEKDPDADSSDSDDESVPAECLPTLDDLHKFCGGATGHRAAMAGMKMGGKLARVAAHDKMFEERQAALKQSAESVPNSPFVNESYEETKGEKKTKHKKVKDKETSSSEISTPKHFEENPDSPQAKAGGCKSEKKKKQKKDKIVDNSIDVDTISSKVSGDLSKCLEDKSEKKRKNDMSVYYNGKEIDGVEDITEDIEPNSCAAGEIDVKGKKKKKKRKKIMEELPHDNEEKEDIEIKKSKKKKKRRENDIDEQNSDMHEVEKTETPSSAIVHELSELIEQEDENNSKEKKKKKKRKRDQKHIDEDVLEPSQNNEITERPKKKKRKKE